VVRDVELPIRVEVNVVLLVSLWLGVVDSDEDEEAAAEDVVVLINVELLGGVVSGVVEVSVVCRVVVVPFALLIVVVSVSVEP